MNIVPRDPTPDSQTVALRGDIDLKFLGHLHHWLHTQFDPPGRRFILDLTEVSFLDCAGYRALLAVEDYTKAGGGSVRLAGTSPPVARLIELLELPAGSSFLAGAPVPSSLGTDTRQGAAPEHER